MSVVPYIEKRISLVSLRNELAMKRDTVVVNIFYNIYILHGIYIREKEIWEREREMKKKEKDILKEQGERYERMCQ